MDTTNEQENVDVDAEEEADEASSEPSNDISELQNRIKTLEEKTITHRERRRADKLEIAKLRKELQALQGNNAPKDEKKADDFGLLEKSFLRAAGITAEDEVELARTTAKKWGMEIDKLVDDEDFKAKLEKLRTKKANELATSNIRGGAGKNQGSDDPSYWLAKGVPPTPEEVPDRKARAKIVRSMMANKGSGSPFYNG